MTKVAYDDVDDLLTKVGFTKQDIAKVKKGYVVNSVNIETLSDRDLATMIAFELEELMLIMTLMHSNVLF